MKVEIRGGDYYKVPKELADMPFSLVSLFVEGDTIRDGKEQQIAEVADRCWKREKDGEWTFVLWLKA